MSKSPKITVPPEGDAFTPITLRDDMERNLAGLTKDELNAVCERLRDEIRRRTVALASAMHELRTPLAVLDGYLALLESKKTGHLTETQRSIVNDMKANEKRLKIFVSDFLT